MSACTHNIVQAEFFLVGGLGTSNLKILWFEMKERLLDGAPIKICIRFPDQDEYFTYHCAMYNKQAAWWLSQQGGFLERNSLTRWYFYGRLNRLRRTLHTAAIAAIVRTASDKLAIEGDDHSYRAIRRNEIHEIVETIRRSRMSWIFVFAPNQLCADENKILSSVVM